MSNPLRDADYLEHIQDAIAKVFRYTKGKNESDFLGDELVQDGVIRNLEIVGEAVSKLTPELKARHADVPWGDISGMRNRLIHGYVTVNLEIVWSTVVKVLPEFRDKVTVIQRLLSQSGS
ncbi:MAG: DUF86 domain-containing protein [Rhodocyclaceae bacterium]|jgi:uncharacterized protein with HEPN domain|uniref:DUF86 domain-containing protein n=1 Tax=Candidatus Desulfobacillus denitrificans TaxID=2608985 RepID=A0A809RLS2_9PROT|nr:conserved hypothetical protein [Candidatus Desulfobacillus denitrificans]GIK44486.1 MAG: DUF86 domain-containing protein [Betaproteobacteria bacterium]GJQ54729.1 MAG: DUF86 domain-containing protein [Rhodocyclaceae bacterium]